MRLYLIQFTLIFVILFYYFVPCDQSFILLTFEKLIVKCKVERVLPNQEIILKRGLFLELPENSNNNTRNF